ncbi:hypothetical protein [Microbacterium sp. PA5]|uniref:hypothetical protein n=1 Tax=Microbacterium sp. PA5 TaxID=3416654 RepID=UPI003CEDC36A
MLTAEPAPRQTRQGAISALTIMSASLSATALLLWALAYAGPIGILISFLLIPVHAFLAVKLVGDVALSALAAARRSRRAMWANAIVTVIDAALVAWGHAYGFSELVFMMIAHG